MSTFGKIFATYVLLLVIVWAGILVCTIIDKLRGYKPPELEPEAEEDGVSEEEPEAPVRWWVMVLSVVHVCLSSLVLLAFSALVVALFWPMTIVEWIRGRGARAEQQAAPDGPSGQ